MITQAFVLGAGLGTRLRPLTDDLPKPLIPIFQKPLITFALDHLLSLGVESFIINTHHRPEKFADVFGRGAADVVGRDAALWRPEGENLGVPPGRRSAASLPKGSLPTTFLPGSYRD